MKRILLTLICFSFFLTGFAQNLAGGVKVVEIKTSAICSMCKKRIERDISLSKGVEKAELNLENKVLTVAYNGNRTNSEEIRKAVTRIGYDADKLPADSRAHDRLPACCQKTSTMHID